MEVIPLDELSLGAGLVVQDMKEQETPSRSIRGAVAMDTEAEEKRRKREERWMKLYPEIKKCVIVITRPSPEKLAMLKLKEERREEEEEEEVEEEEEKGGGRSGDPEPDCDWMKPLELNDIGDRRFVKKVEVKVSHAPANRRGKPCGDVLRLRHDDVTTDPAHRRQLRSRSVNNSQSTTEHNYSVVATPVKDDPDGDTPNSQSQDASLSPSCGQKDSGSSEKKKPPNIVFKKVDGDQWVLGRSKVKKEKEEEEEEEDGGSSISDASQPEVKKKRERWLWAQRKAKKRQSEEDVWTPELPKMKTRMKETSPKPITMTKRQGACRKCTACLREDCGKCINCLDKRKFGGPATRKQRCQLRVCLVVETKKIRPKPLKTIEAAKEEVTTATLANTVTTVILANTVTTATSVNTLSTVTMATPANTLTTMTTPTRPHRRHQGRRQTCQKDTTEEEEMEMRKMRRWWRQFGKNKAKINRERGWTHLKTKCKEEEEETEVKKKRRWWLWARRRAKRRQSEEEEWTPELLRETEEMEKKKMQEEEPKKETHPPQFPAFTLVSGTAELLNGTNIQLNLTLDGSHFSPSILSDSTLNSLSALLPQEGSVLHTSTGLTFIPPPAAPPPSLQPKEEEEAVDIHEYGRTGGKGGQREDGGTMEEEEEAAGGMKEEEEEECGEGVTEEGKYYEIQVEMPGLHSNEETLTAASSLSGIAEVTDDVTAHDDISLSSGSFSLLGGSGGGDEVTCGRRLSRLLQELRKTVLPAHWVAVLADGPLLQLLQCSRLSSMLTTIIHIQPDLCFFITVENQLLPDTHTLYQTHTQRITRLSQLVSLLLELEGFVVCRDSRVRSCHLLVTAPRLTCLPCRLGDEGEEDEEEEDDEEEEVEEDISDKQS
ncbi:DNA ligase 1-like isoform X2 [Thunnus albacares]|uniref:DNA ligase 1-like isoform X2 n=1 Tax=Thunnus albacares TaxID=8236 RepID=UPI001CF6E9FD|nr:DNA ligase 1-like isoform X2 [Thunnus albacares]